MAGPFRDGKVHVLSRMRVTCIFRPGNRMSLELGRAAGMVAEAKGNEAAITCHSTLYRSDVEPAVCRGFFDRHATVPLQIAQRLGYLVEDEPPKEET